MALQQYRIPQFLGLNQGACENGIDAGESPDARNMDTAGGQLRVARGYVRHHEAAHPAPGDVLGMAVWRRGDVRRFLTATPTGYQVLAEDGTAFSTVYTSDTAIAQADFQTVKLGSTEHTLLAGGGRQIVKWTGRARRPPSAAPNSFRTCRCRCSSCTTAACSPRATRNTRAACTGAARRATSAPWRTGRRRRPRPTSAAGTWRSAPTATRSPGCSRCPTSC